MTKITSTRKPKQPAASAAVATKKKKKNDTTKKQEAAPPITKPAAEQSKAVSSDTAVVHDKQTTKKQEAAPPFTKPASEQSKTVSSDTAVVHDKQTTSRAPRNEPIFPTRFHDFCTKAARDHPNVVLWIKDGAAAEIRSYHKDFQKILEDYFGPKTTYHCITRKLYAYEFKKSYPDLAWEQPYFHRDLEKCQFDKILRKKTERKPKKRKGTKNSAAADGDAVDSYDDESEEFDSSSSQNSHSIELDEEKTVEGSGFKKEVEEAKPDPGLAAITSVVEEKEAKKQKAPKATVLVHDSEEEARPDPKYKVFQTVYARDTDGIIYEAVIRRKLYGQNQRKQVQMGLVTSEQEALELLAQEEEPTWHYFVHYNNWNVNWDRWVKEENVFPVGEKIKELAKAIVNEHKALKQDLAKKHVWKKAHQTIDGAEFLRLWRTRKSKLEEEVDKLRVTPATESTLIPEYDGVQTKKDKKRNPVSRKTDAWTRASVAIEVGLRKKNLARGSKHANLVNVSFALKKVLVEHWEIIGQCQVVLALPAPITVRDALTAYLKTKGVEWGSSESLDDEADAEPATVDKLESPQEEKLSSPGKEVSIPTSPAKTPGKESTEKAASPFVWKPSKREEGMTKSQISIRKEWISMAEGITQFFDQAIPDRLLYREEMPQFHVLEEHPEYCRKRYCDIYGCGHLLRLFVRLPDLIMDELSEAEARPIFAKINDFLRFINKNQGTLMAQPYRKLNDLEKKEQVKFLKLEEKKRKLANLKSQEGSQTSGALTSNKKSKVVAT